MPYDWRGEVRSTIGQGLSHFGGRCITPAEVLLQGARHNALEIGRDLRTQLPDRRRLLLENATDLRGLMRAGRTVILVTHHIHEIPPEVSRVVLLKDGAVIADGAKENILTNANLSRLFDTPIAVACANGFYQALPGTQ